jgi:hypothetical protein
MSFVKILSSFHTITNSHKFINYLLIENVQKLAFYKDKYKKIWLKEYYYDKSSVDIKIRK